MSAVVTDQFRISNAGNFVDSVLDTNNNYYVFLGLSIPTTPNPGFGRTSTWNTTPPDPIDNYPVGTIFLTFCKSSIFIS